MGGVNPARVVRGGQFGGSLTTVSLAITGLAVSLRHLWRGGGAPTLRVILYTILSLPILYGVWLQQGGSGGGHVLRKRRAVVLQ